MEYAELFCHVTVSYPWMEIKGKQRRRTRWDGGEDVVRKRRGRGSKFGSFIKETKTERGGDLVVRDIIESISLTR